MARQIINSIDVLQTINQVRINFTMVPEEVKLSNNFKLKKITLSIELMKISDDCHRRTIASSPTLKTIHATTIIIIFTITIMETKITLVIAHIML